MRAWMLAAVLAGSVAASRAQDPVPPSPGDPSPAPAKAVPAAPSDGLDPGVVEAALICDGVRQSLPFVQVVSAPGRARTLWIWVTDAELAAAEARSPKAVRRRVESGALRGARLEVSTQKLANAPVRGTVYPGPLPMKAIALTAPKRRWDRILVGDHRVLGKARLTSLQPGPQGCVDWALEVRFSAPML